MQEASTIYCKNKERQGKYMLTER